MTLLLSLVHPDGIVMAADSRKTTDVTPRQFETMEPTGPTRQEYSSMNKMFKVPDIGCVTMWGDVTRIAAKVPALLSSIQVSNVEQLSDELLAFLRKEIVEGSDGDIGFHVGGYKPNGEQALYHVFFGREVGPGVDEVNNPQVFNKHDHSNFLALYNGKHEIAHSVITFLLALQEQVGIVTWVTKHPLEKAVNFADFVLRYASEIDPTVGDDIKVVTISRGNKCDFITNLRQPLSGVALSVKGAELSPPPSGMSLPESKSVGTASRGN